MEHPDIFAHRKYFKNKFWKPIQQMDKVSHGFGP